MDGDSGEQEWGTVGDIRGEKGGCECPDSGGERGSEWGIVGEKGGVSGG